MPRNLTDPFKDSRREDGTIDLVKAYMDLYGPPSGLQRRYMEDIEMLFPVNSRQAAAQIIITAWYSREI